MNVEVLLPSVETVFLCVEYTAMCVFDQVCPLVTASFHLSQGMVNVDIVVFSSCSQMFCFALPESLSVFLDRGVADVIKTAIFS